MTPKETCSSLLDGLTNPEIIIPRVSEASIRALLPDDFPKYWKTSSVRDGELHNPAHPLRCLILGLHLANYLECKIGILVDRDALAVSLLMHDIARKDDTQSDLWHGQRAYTCLNSPALQLNQPFAEMLRRNPYGFRLGQLICAHHTSALKNSPLNCSELIIHKVVDGIERLRDKNNHLDIQRVWEKLTHWTEFGFELAFLENLISLDNKLIRLTQQEITIKNISAGTEEELNLTIELARRVGLLASTPGNV